MNTEFSGTIPALWKEEKLSLWSKLQLPLTYTHWIIRIWKHPPIQNWTDHIRVKELLQILHVFLKTIPWLCGEEKTSWPQPQPHITRHSPRSHSDWRQGQAQNSGLDSKAASWQKPLEHTLSFPCTWPWNLILRNCWPVLAFKDQGASFSYCYPGSQSCLSACCCFITVDPKEGTP